MDPEIEKVTMSVRLALSKVSGLLAGKDAQKGDWTKAVKKELTKAGNELKCRVAANGVDNAKDVEWLFDVVWMTLDWKPSRQLKRIHLVVESEFGNVGDIADDFEKLLVARSDVRLMVFKKRNKSKVEEEFNRLEKEAREFCQRQSGDYYILAGHDDAKSKFLWREFSV